MQRKWFVLFAALVLFSLMIAPAGAAGAQVDAPAFVPILSSAPRSAAAVASLADDPSPPTSPVRLVFVHHSTGGNWLADDNGGLGIALRNNNYFVSATNYGWGPDSIGDRTDIPDWPEWFTGTNSSAILTALYNESSQNFGDFGDWSRLATNPGGGNEIIMFKSCFPNSALEGNPADPPSADGWLTVGHAKYVYNEILQYFATRPDKLFVVITAPPLSDPTYAANARAFNQWLMNNWLAENSYTLGNVVVFDFYNVLTGPDNHHRYFGGAIQYVFTPGMNTLYYPTDDGNDHPSVAGNQKATAEFVQLLNVFYHRWRAGIVVPTDFVYLPLVVR